MGLRIQNNIAAFNAHRNLKIADNGLSKSLEKLSSGFRINKASDDAAGLAVSMRFRSQIKSLQQAGRNASEANSLLQVAEGAGDQITNILQRMKELALHVSKNFGKKIMFSKTPAKNIEPVFSPDKDLSVTKIKDGIMSVLHNLPKKAIAIPQKVVEKVISLEEMIENLTERINKNLKMSFKEFSGIGKEEKVNVIVSFLAMLELVKQGIVSVTQDKHFSDITMETDNIGTPKYD